MFGIKSLKTVLVCQAPSFIRYSQPVTVTSVMFVAVLDNNSGIAGASCIALAIIAVGLELMLPSQLAAVTVTVIVLPISSCSKV